MTFTYRYTTLNSYTVTYNIVNGTWGGTLTTVTELVKHGDTLALIPANMTASAAYTQNAGAWDSPAPISSTVITGPISFTYRYSILNTYSATVNLYRDGALWNSGSPPVITLVKDDDASNTQRANGSPVLPGTYKIYANGVDTGETIVVTSGPATKTLSYWTVTFAVANEGAATGSSISATYNGAPISSGAVVLGGKALVITAVGAGASGSYTYSWAGTGTSGETTAVYSRTNLGGTVNATCTVTGADAVYIATVYVNKDGSAWNGETVPTPDVFALYNASTSGTLVKTLTATGTGVFTATDLLPSTYYIYRNGVYTGATITITNADNSTTLHYFTLRLTSGTGITTVNDGGTPATTIEKVYLASTSITIDAVVGDPSFYEWARWVATPTQFGDQTTKNLTFNMPSYALTLQATTLISYTATVILTLDDVAWNSTTTPTTVDLRTTAGAPVKSLSENNPGVYPGVYTANVPAGTYEIYKDGVRTGRTITVSGNPAASTETLNYYTVTYKAIPDGDTVSASVSAPGWSSVMNTINNGPEKSGSGVALQNTKVTFTAVGYGVIGQYDYLWAIGAGAPAPGTAGYEITVSGKMDVTCIVSGVAAPVPKTSSTYSVEHILIDADGNHNIYTEQLSGLINKTVTAIPKTGYVGYEYNAGAPGEVKSAVVVEDGSLVLRLYYKPIVYKIIYEYLAGTTAPDGAPSLPPIEDAAYGSSQSVKPDLSFGSYTFRIWGTPDVLVTGGAFVMPNNNVTFYGSWIETAIAVQYRVEHYIPGTSTPYETELFFGAIGESVTATPKTGYVGYIWNQDASDATGQIVDETTDLTLKLYYTAVAPLVFTITYVIENAPEGTPPAPHDPLLPINRSSFYYKVDVPVGTLYSVEPTDPFAFGGYAFGGWQTSDAMVNWNGTASAGEFKMPAQDVLFVGTYDKSLFTVTFVDGAGNTLDTQLVAYGTNASAPSSPTRAGQTFTGWDSSFNDVMTDLTITAKFTTPVGPHVTPPPPPPTQYPWSLNPGENDEFAEDEEEEELEEDVVDNADGGGGAGGGAGAGGGSEYIDDAGEPGGTRGAYAIINLLLMLLTVLTAAATIMAYFNRRTFIEIDKAKQEEYNYEYGYEYEEEYNARVKKYPLFRIMALGIALGALVVFLVTQDLTGEMMFADQYSMFHLIAFIATVLLTSFSLKKYIAEDDELYDEAI